MTANNFISARRIATTTKITTKIYVNLNITSGLNFIRRPINGLCLSSAICVTNKPTLSFRVHFFCFFSVFRICTETIVFHGRALALIHILNIILTIIHIFFS